MTEADGPPPYVPAVASCVSEESSLNKQAREFRPTFQGSRHSRDFPETAIVLEAPGSSGAHHNAHARSARARRHTVRTRVRQRGVFTFPRAFTAYRARVRLVGPSPERVSRTSLARIYPRFARVMARVIDVGGSRPAFEPRSSSAEAVDVMLDPKEEVRFGGTRAFPRVHSPRARAGAGQILLETAEASLPAHAFVPSVPQAALEHTDLSLADMHIPSLEDIVAHDDGGLSWYVARPRAPSSFPRRRVASDVSFSSPPAMRARRTRGVSIPSRNHRKHRAETNRTV